MSAGEFMTILDKLFFDRPTLTVARDLLGKKLLRREGPTVLSGVIVETEAYCGRQDTACHAHRGMTRRNAVMFGPPGHAYVYFTYEMHYMLNIVTEAEGRPCAVLIRAIRPLEGIAEMLARRAGRGKNLTDGPAKLCQALGIDKSFNGWNLAAGEKLWVEKYRDIPARDVCRTPRIGIGYADKKDREALWRFYVKGSDGRGKQKGIPV